MSIREKRVPPIDFFGIVTYNGTIPRRTGGERLDRSFMIEAGVSLECRNCGKRTTVPALKVVPGVKCQNCRAELAVDDAAYGMKAALLQVAATRNDVAVD